MNVSNNTIISAKDVNACSIQTSNRKGNTTLIVSNTTQITVAQLLYWNCECGGPCGQQTWKSVGECMANFNQ